MALNLDPRERYDMPAHFGPSIVPARTEVARAESLVLSTTTDRAAVEAILPPHFTVPDEPSLTIAHMAYHDIDYLGGRSYNELVVSVGAQYERGDESIRASIGIALWVDQPGALIAGREFMGLPKLMGRISDLDADMRFSCAEFDAVIAEGGASAMKPIDGEKLQRLNERAGEVRTFGWKYVAAAGGGSDVDTPVLNVMRWSYEQASTGEGDFRFLPATFADAPMSAAVVAALADLPHRSPVRAFRGVGRATIDRTATRRLEAA